MPKNYQNRERKLKAKKQAMKMNGRGLITVTIQIIAKKAKEAK